MTLTPEQRRDATIDYLLDEGRYGAVQHDWVDAGVSRTGSKKRICKACDRIEVLRNTRWRMPQESTPGDPDRHRRTQVAQLVAHGMKVPDLMRPPLAPAHIRLQSDVRAGFAAGELLRDQVLLTVLDYLQEIRPDILDTIVSLNSPRKQP